MLGTGQLHSVLRNPYCPLKPERLTRAIVRIKFQRAGFCDTINLSDCVLSNNFSRNWRILHRAPLFIQTFEFATNALDLGHCISGLRRRRREMLETRCPEACNPAQPAHTLAKEGIALPFLRRAFVSLPSRFFSPLSSADWLHQSSFSFSLRLLDRIRAKNLIGCKNFITLELFKLLPHPVG